MLIVTSQFKVGSSFAMVPTPVGEAAAFFACFDQLEINDLDPTDFWGSDPPYVDFHGFKIPQDCVSHLEAVFNSRGDFMQGFHLGRSVKEHFLKLLGSVMNDIEHNFVDTVSSERILQRRVAVQELISVGFVVEFVLWNAFYNTSCLTHKSMLQNLSCDPVTWWKKRKEKENLELVE